MKAVGIYQHLPIDHDKSLVDLYVDRPQPGPRDLLVSVRAISVNPVDTKVRASGDRPTPCPRILGWDAAGEVLAVGSEVQHYQAGERVYYAGDLTRSGSYCEAQLVDERLVGRMPGSLGFAEAAALPLTALTAWEALFERLGIATDGSDAGRTLLVIGGAGGVGSIAIQLARKVANLRVIATASRTKSSIWVKKLGAHHVVNHHNPVDEALREHDFESVDYILCLNDTDQHFAAMASAIAPQGRICAIVDNREPLPMNLLKPKSATFCWEFMFTRAMFRTADMARQGEILSHLAGLVERGEIRTTLNQTFSPINASNLRAAHRLLEEGRTIGKIVLEGW